MQLLCDLGATARAARRLHRHRPATIEACAVIANPFASPIVATTVVRKEPSKKLGPAEAPAIPPFSLQAAGPVLTPLVAAPIKVAGADTTTQAK